MAPGIARKGGDRGNRDQEDDRQPHQQDRQRDLVGGFLALGPFDQRDHAVEEALSRFLRHAHGDRVGQHAGACRHRAAVAARLADDRRAFAGDGRLVDRGHARDHFAIGGDQLAGLDHHDGAARQFAGRDMAPVGQVGDQIGLGGAQRGGLCPPASFGQAFGKGAEQHRQPEPADQLRLKACGKPAAADQQQHAQEEGDHRRREQHGVADQLAGASLNTASRAAGSTRAGENIVRGAGWACEAGDWGVDIAVPLRKSGRRSA
jgi:hypothetical protein